MKVDEVQKSTASQNEIQMKQEPFFKKDGQGGFFSKSNKTVTSFFNPSTTQPKLTVGKPNDKFEVEADEMADKVVQRLSTTTTNSPKYIQPKCNDCEQEEKLQKKEEDEVLQNELEVQRKPIFESNTDEPENNLQKKPLPNVKLQRKCASCEEKEKLQKKEDEFSETEEDIQEKSETTQNQSSYDVESDLNSSKGGGRPLSANVEKSMGSAFGADFSNVRVHTGSQAVQMSKALGAQAFTHGSDIYFNQGKYDTNSSSGKHLLAHELTHTVQQGKSNLVQKQDDLGEYEEPVFEPTEKQLTDMEEGTPVETNGVVQHDEGTTLWPQTNRVNTSLGILPLNTRVFVDRKDKHGWYSVYVMGHQEGSTLPVKKGTHGYIPAHRINIDMPDPGARLYRITKEGQGALSLAIELFPGHVSDCLIKNSLFTLACKNDFRFLVNVLTAVNQSKGRRYIYKDNPNDSWVKTKTKKGQIWVPGKQLVEAMRGQVSSGSISYEMLSTLADIAIGIAAFVVGLLHGAVMSIADVFIGLYDLVVLIKDIIVKLFKGTLISDAKAFFKDISKIKMSDILKMVGEKWNHPNVWDRWKFRGYVIGYAIVEILMLVFSGGIVTAIKWAGKAGKFGKLAKYLGKLKSVQKIMNKANTLKGKGVEKVRKALKAANALSEAHGWAARVLRIPLGILKRLSKADIGKLKKLPQWARERFARMANNAKLRLLGCSSPCKVDVDEIQKALKLVSKGGKVLSTVDDVIRALPKGLNKIKISRKLRKKGSALMTAIKEAGLTDKDFLKLADFLTPGDANLAQGYRTFTRYLTSVIPAKTGKDIKKLNKILAEMIKAEPRRGAALKGAMFEQWIALHVPKLASKTFGRISFDLKKLIGKAKPPYTRTVDKWLPSAGEIWDMKHQLSKVPTGQADDYLALIGKVAPDGNTVKAVNYLFPTKEAAELNKALSTVYGFGVHYIDNVTNKLVKI
ncbi:eCIS core domain-containing protein [Aquimarina mytili]|uniref:DUF4157 domain-containing protein n=1 Tax=Aquimarina mytili TaxID=874423 RepID=A0A937A2M5_9FLAO|nr:DUF4157 domain-containing protein [Aquimarina mytili]MBL0683840.1 DUF4157 domain-containing protein [Aquimarina mytili]